MNRSGTVLLQLGGGLTVESETWDPISGAGSPVLSPRHQYPIDINNAGGRTYSHAGANSSYAPLGGSLITIPNLPNSASTYNTPRESNSAGRVVGGSGQHAFVWDAGTGIIDLGHGEASDVNELGEVAGRYYTDSGSFDDFFYWSASAGAVRLPDVAAIQDLSDLGYVVGQTTSGSAYMWSENGGLADLTSLVTDGSGAGWTLVEAEQMNDSGQIVGYGVHDGVTHGFLLTPLTPLPEPAAALALPIPAAGILSRRRHA
jgi:hypothetical protein